ncbi:hypothetical protein FAVG1_00008 [Fusarium avenaceum]|nr:hypothetical protein FAVG1_00008 [Fusarium avenaceum]
MPTQFLKDRVLAAAGPLPGQLTIENMKRWTSLRKGVFLEDFDDNVTHLLCTKEQFDKKVPRVKEALKRKRVYIVHCDWFEFSTTKNKRLAEADYSMRSLQAKENAKRRETERLEKGRRNGQKFVNTNFFHLYRDRENFVYEVDITRDDPGTGEPGQKYTLYLWESNPKPHLYRFTTKFLKRKGSSQPSYFCPSPCEGKWRGEMNLFMDFFKKKTGVDWLDRITYAYTGLNASFQYTPPAEGRPVGRRLRHSLDYCREINAHIRGLPWPPVKDAEVRSIPTEEDDDAGPRNFDDDDEVPEAPPDTEHVPAEHEPAVTTMEVDEAEPRKEGHQGRLETPPHDIGEEPETALTSPILPAPSDTSPVKPATPAPSNDGDGEPEVPVDTPVTGDEESSKASLMEIESQEPETTPAITDSPALDDGPSAKLAAPEPSGDANDVGEIANDTPESQVEEIGVGISLELKSQKPETTIASPDPSTLGNTSSASPAVSATPAPSKDSSENPGLFASNRMVRDKATGMWISLEFEPREPI